MSGVDAGIAEMEELVAERHFEEAIRLSYDLLGKKPDDSRVFRLRLLAAKECATSEELLCRGLDCERDADFCNALRFAPEEERQDLLQLQAVMEGVGRQLQSALQSRLLCELYESDVLKDRRDVQEEYNLHQRELLNRWKALQNIEQEMCEDQMGCLLLQEEIRWTYQDTADSVDAVLAEHTQENQGYTDVEYARFAFRLNSAREERKQSKELVEQMKEVHPWVRSVREAEDRSEAVAAIEEGLDSLRLFNDALEAKLSDLRNTEQRYRHAMAAVEQYDFAEAETLLGTETLLHIVKEAR